MTPFVFYDQHQNDIYMLFLEPIPFSPYKPISQYYRLGDLVCDRDAYDRKIYEQYLYDSQIEDNLKRLAAAMLDFLCAEVGHKIYVYRGYLHPRLAKFHEGGGVTYQHGFGALLLPRDGAEYEAIWDKACVLEHDLNVAYPRHIYVSLKSAFNQNINRISYDAVL